MIWFLLESGPGEHAWNMALDEALLEFSAKLRNPVLRFYSWTEPAASFGYFQKFSEVEKMTPLRPLVRRPTAGGIVPHDADWTYSLIFPLGHHWHKLSACESYRAVHEWIRDAFKRLDVPTEVAPAAKISLPGQCFVGHERFDLLFHGRKIAGAAQRRNRLGLLIQGSVQPPPGAKRDAWEKAMREVASVRWNANWKSWSPEAAICRRATELAGKKYSQETFLKKR